MFHVKDTFKLQDLRSHCQTLTAASGLWPDTVSGSGWGTRLTHDIHSGSVKRTFNSSAYSVTWMTNPEVKQRRQFSLSWLWVPDHRVHRDCPSPLCSPQTRTHSDSKATTTLCQHSPASTSSAPPTLLLPPSCACVITWSESPLPSPNSVNQECVCVCHWYSACTVYENSRLGYWTICTDSSCSGLTRGGRHCDVSQVSSSPAGLCLERAFCVAPSSRCSPRLTTVSIHFHLSSSVLFCFKCHSKFED